MEIHFNFTDENGVSFAGSFSTSSAPGGLSLQRKMLALFERTLDVALMTPVANTASEEE